MKAHPSLIGSMQPLDKGLELWQGVISAQGEDLVVVHVGYIRHKGFQWDTTQGVILYHTLAIVQGQVAIPARKQCRTSEEHIDHVAILNIYKTSALAALST
jgi:hypothetical protein